jgi:hypothetical protein
MAYIGREPQIGNFQVCDAISVVNGQAAYTMQVNSVNVSPETANHMLVSLNGVLQAPGSSYTVSGSTITFASNLVTGDVINFIHILGSVLDLGVPSDSTVSLAKLTATGTKNSTTFLRGDNTFAEVPAGGITEADMYRLTTNFASSVDPISSNLERVDDASFAKIGTGMSVSSGIFTFAATGLYEVTFNLDGRSNATTWDFRISATQNNSSYDLVAIGQIGSSDNRGSSGRCSAFINVTNTSNVKVKFLTTGMNGSDTEAYGDTDTNRTCFSFIRLGDSQ